MHAAREGQLQMVRFIWDNYKEKVNMELRNADGWSAFMYAACNGYLNTCEYMHQTMDVNIDAEDKFKRTALHWAARFNNPKVTQMLLEFNANFNALDVEN